MHLVRVVHRPHDDGDVTRAGVGDESMAVHGQTADSHGYVGERASTAPGWQADPRMRAGDERCEVAPGQRGRELKSDLVAQSAQPARSRAADADPVRRPCLKQLPRQVPDRSLLLEVDRKERVREGSKRRSERWNFVPAGDPQSLQFGERLRADLERI